MTQPEFQGQRAPSFTLSATIPDGSATALADEQTELNGTETEDYQTWNWGEAAIEVGVNESTLRKVWWEEELEPAFRHSPQPLRVVTRTTKKTGREISEFTTFGIEVLEAYKTTKAKGDRAAQLFLVEAKAQYPAPASPTEPPKGGEAIAPAAESPAIRPEVMLPSAESSAANDRPSEVVVYERSRALAQLLNRRLAPKAPQVPEQNTTFLQVRDRLNQLEQRTLHTRRQVLHTAQSHADTAESLEVLEDLELIERIRAKAQRHFQLEQDVYREELDLLKTQTVLGK